VPRDSAFGGRFEAKTRAPSALLPSHITINEVGSFLSDKLLAAGSTLGRTSGGTWGDASPQTLANDAACGQTGLAPDNAQTLVTDTGERPSGHNSWYADGVGSSRESRRGGYVGMTRLRLT